MKSHTTRFLFALAAFAALGSVACGRDGSPSGPDPSVGGAAALSSSSSSGHPQASTETTPITAEDACPAGLETRTVDGVTACVHETDFDVERCVTPEMLEGKSELVLKMGFVNGSPFHIYNKPGLFHTRTPTCGAIQEGPGRAIENVTGFPIDAGSSGIATWTFPLDRDSCGTYAFLDTVRNGGEILFAPMHYVINTGKECPLTCGDLDLKLVAIERGLMRNGKFAVDFTATWEGTGATGTLHKKATGGNTVTSTTSPISHRFRYNPLPYFLGQTAVLEVKHGSLTCTTSVDVGGGLPPV